MDTVLTEQFSLERLDSIPQI